MPLNNTPNFQASTHPSWGTEANASSWTTGGGGGTAPYSDNTPPIDTGSFKIQWIGVGAGRRAYRSYPSTVFAGKVIGVGFAISMDSGSNPVTLRVELDVGGQVLEDITLTPPAPFVTKSYLVETTGISGGLTFRCIAGAVYDGVVNIDSMYVYYYSKPVPWLLEVNSLTNPTVNIASPILFDCRHGGSEGVDYSRSYQIQVAEDAGFATLVWDPGWAEQSDYPPGTPYDSRIPQFPYAGPALTAPFRYYWRIKLRNQDGVEGNWDTEGAFFDTIGGNLPPDPPTDLTVTGLHSTAPNFSFRFNDPNG